MLGLGKKSKNKVSAPPKYTATMQITPGLTVRALVKTPPGFMPIAGEPPLWLQNGTEIGLVGSLNGRTEILGFSGAGYQNERLIAADDGPGARNGRIVGLAASPDGLTLAIAEGEPGRVRIVLRYVLSKGGQNTVASFDGTFHAVSLDWIGNDRLAVGLAAKSGPQPAQTGTPAPAAAPATAGGLFYIKVAGAVKIVPVTVPCALSPLAFSPDARFMVGEGDAEAGPMIFERRTNACQPLRTGGPMRVLGWAPDDAAFLYAAPATRLHGPGVFRYTIATGRSELIAVASGAAAYINSGGIVALGNQQLTYRGALADPNRIVTAELARFAAKKSQVHVQSLDFPTTPRMLMASTMTYTPGFAQVAIQMYAAVQGQGPTREIVTFSLTDNKAFVIAHGPLRGTAEIGWSRKANQLVIFDGADGNGMLAVVVPYR